MTIAEDNKQKLISIIIPVYNVEEYLRDCLDSILRAEEKNLEIIAVNDGSTDGSLEILQSYQDDRLKVFSKANEGLFKTWQYGVLQASGEYIFFVDSDDWVNSQIFRRINDLLNGKDYDLIQFAYELLRGEGKVEMCFVDENLAGGGVCGETLNSVRKKIFSNIRNQSLVSRAGKVFRASLVRDMLPLLIDRITMHEDRSFVIPFYFQCQSVYFDPTVAYYYRIRPNSICTTISAERMRMYAEDCRRLINYFSDNRDRFGFPKEVLNMQVYAVTAGRCSVLMSQGKYYKEALSLLNEEPFIEALKTVDKSNFSRNEKIKFRLLKKKRLRTLRFLLKSYAFFKKK